MISMNRTDYWAVSTAAGTEIAVTYARTAGTAIQQVIGNPGWNRGLASLAGGATARLLSEHEVARRGLTIEAVS